MVTIATVPPEPTPQKHHGRLRWTSRWMENGKQKAYRFGDATDLSKRQVMVMYADWLTEWRTKAAREARNGSRFTVREMAESCRAWSVTKFGEKSSSHCNIDMAMRDLIDVYGDEVVNDVDGPRS